MFSHVCRWLGTTLILAVLGGCGNAEPSEADGRQAMEARVQKCLRPVFSTKDFRKTNGMSQGPQYMMQFAATLSYQVDEPKFVAGLGCLFVSDWKFSVDKVKQELSASGWLAFFKTENGWIGAPIE